MLSAGAAAAGLSLALGAGEASDILGAYRTGVAGQAGIILVCLAYAPNAAVWAAAYLLGPGFAVGVDTTVRTTEVTVGGLPAVPLVSGIPHGPVGGLGAALLAVPVVAGMLAGWLLARRLLRRGEREWGGVLGAAALAGPVAGALLGAAAVASSGALGGGRLTTMGPVGLAGRRRRHRRGGARRRRRRGRHPGAGRPVTETPRAAARGVPSVRGQFM